MGGHQGQSVPVRKISAPPRFDHRNVQPVTGWYTDWAIPVNILYIRTKQDKEGGILKYTVNFSDELRNYAVSHRHKLGSES
jgi:hypothetical protein